MKIPKELSAKLHPGRVGNGAITIKAAHGKLTQTFFYVDRDGIMYREEAGGPLLPFTITGEDDNGDLVEIEVIAQGPVADEQDKAFAYMFWGLCASQNVGLLNVDWQKPDYLKELMPQLMMAGINSGAFAEAGVSDETIGLICKDLDIPNAIEAWEVDMQQACAQNRALLVGE